MHPFIKFRNTLLREGLEAFGLFYGFYEGVISDIEDPEVRARIKLKCPAVYGNNEYPKWARPFGMFSGTKVGFYAIPPVGSQVWVTFKNGNPEFPLWTYGDYPQNKAPDEAGEGKFLYITPKGYKLLFDEKEELTTLYFDKDRSITMDKDKTVITSGNNIVNIADKIKIEFGGVSMVDYLDELTTIIKTGTMTGATPGPYVFIPDVILKFEASVVKLKQMME